MEKKGMPGLRGVEHIGFTVPDLEEATRFFVDVLGCEQFYDIGPFQVEGDWMARQLNVHHQTEMKKLRFFRCGHGSNFEVFEYDAPDQRADLLKNSDIGGHHLAFYTDDFDDAVAWLRSHGVEILGDPVSRNTGPSAGQSWVYFLAPWGMQLELVSYPEGKGYEQFTDRRLWNPTAPSE
ncbi:VOC family protein [Ruegeria sp. 2012CJ41-6]|uniref:VOC family protein n=1 Tax=Ruegeria spongiae TaxID=2942209 RepID=A0ABT0Q2R7_9RHOB|nr:VOC family protein [Ruegeria spongiae]MCL6284171.1 VOC family protein [Ruegeria spongiae]